MLFKFVLQRETGWCEVLNKFKKCSFGQMAKARLISVNLLGRDVHVSVNQDGTA